MTPTTTVTITTAASTTTTTSPQNEWKRSQNEKRAQKSFSSLFIFRTCEQAMTETLHWMSPLGVGREEKEKNIFD